MFLVVKHIRTVQSKIEADILVGVLASHGINAVTDGIREYASVVTGTDYNQYKILVAEEVEEEALKVLSADAVPETENTPTPISSDSYLKRSVIFAVLAWCVLPIVFNYASLTNLQKYRQSGKSSAKKLMWTAAILILNVLGLMVWPVLFLL